MNDDAPVWKKSRKLYGHKKFNIHLLDCPKTTKKLEYRLKMYYYPIKANDSRPNPNPIFIMSASRKCVWIIFNVAAAPQLHNSALPPIVYWNDDLKHETIKSDLIISNQPNC